ncbi:hypothetical protein [Tenacibaculum caenipelagi]|uniref:Uncharacterized protein n=1 Tax=Tenacibaculum caenipelagi TaxID=1325435 RepID=A0A4V6PW85_9FLAO|nr:hypothetical protein [Tenacibaculum caenipelagi]TDQ27684.1 hypothetical protein DFQ07_1535 [Tenacibaculum caenipelagi]
MKIIANNFTGYLTNGNRYKIVVTTKKSIVNNERRLLVEVYESYKDMGVWMYSVANSSTHYYNDTESYISGLRSGLSLIENQLEIKLLKANLTAVA